MSLLCKHGQVTSPLSALFPQLHQPLRLLWRFNELAEIKHFEQVWHMVSFYYYYYKRMCLHLASRILDSENGSLEASVKGLPVEGGTTA